MFQVLITYLLTYSVVCFVELLAIQESSDVVIRPAASLQHTSQNMKGYNLYDDSDADANYTNIII